MGDRRKRRIGLALAVVTLLATGCGDVPRSLGPPPRQVAHHGRRPETTTTASSEPPLGPGRVRILEIGDSLGIDLGWGLGWALRTDERADLVAEARGDTGLVDTAYYDWPTALAAELASVAPQIVVVLLGANDVQSFYLNGRYLAFGSASWRAAYSSRVGELMSEATRAGARVLWVGLPIMASRQFSSDVAEINSLFAAEAASHPGVSYLSCWDLFATRAGQFDGGTTDVTGAPLPLRDPDGIHLAAGGEDLLGEAVVASLRSLYGLS